MYTRAPVSFIDVRTFFKLSDAAQLSELTFITAHRSSFIVHRNKSNINHLCNDAGSRTNIYKTNDEVVQQQQHPTNTIPINMTINPLDDRPISSRERALQPTTISTYHCHKSMQATVAHNNTAIHLPVLAPSFIEVYTYFIIPSALLDQWKLLGVFSTCHS